MLKKICPKLPMKDKNETQNFYVNQLDFKVIGDYDNYLIVEKDEIEIHFFEFLDLNVLENYGQVYIRSNNIDTYYQELAQKNIAIHPNGNLSIKPWGQKEFSLLDPNHNLLTFGQKI